MDQRLRRVRAAEVSGDLIAAINDGTKMAQAGILLYLPVELYLLGTAFSASDEDILPDNTVTISQIGASRDWNSRRCRPPPRVSGSPAWRVPAPGTTNTNR